MKENAVRIAGNHDSRWPDAAGQNRTGAADVCEYPQLLLARRLSNCRKMPVHSGRHSRPCVPASDSKIVLTDSTTRGPQNP